MREVPDDIPSNGIEVRDNRRDCPFYALGTADFHNFVEQFRTHNQLIEKLIYNVPLKTHIISLIVVITACMGAQLAVKFLESITGWIK